MKEKEILHSKKEEYPIQKNNTERNKWKVSEEETKHYIQLVLQHTKSF